MCTCVYVLMNTMRSNGSGVCAARSSSSLYSSSSHNLCRVFSGSFSCTGIATLDRSFPMLFLRMFHRLMLLVLGLGDGSKERRFPWGTPFSTQSKSRVDSLDEQDYSWNSQHALETVSEVCKRYSLKYISNIMVLVRSVQVFIQSKNFDWNHKSKGSELPESPVSNLSFWTSLLKLSMEILSLMSLMYESSSEG